MRNIKLKIEYDGTRFFGFQNQKGGRTVQGELESAVRRVANFTTPSTIPTWKIHRALNHYLPDDVSIVGIGVAPLSFHAQRSAKWKTYEYRVLNARSNSPLERFRVYRFPHPLDVAKMARGARVLTGKHDFRVFEASGSRRNSAVRHVRKLSVKKKGRMVLITIESNGFLYRMVRAIVGSLIDVGMGRLTPEDLEKALTTQNRKLVGPTVPPQGLCLTHVSY
jgi:tRNA pseudouridine38-40 synthase